MATYLALVGGQIVEVEAAGGSAAVPTKVAAGAVYTVSADSQALYADMIDVEGEIVLDGVLIEVN